MPPGAVGAASAPATSTVSALPRGCCPCRRSESTSVRNGRRRRDESRACRRAGRSIGTTPSMRGRSPCRSGSARTREAPCRRGRRLAATRREAPRSVLFLGPVIAGGRVKVAAAGTSGMCRRHVRIMDRAAPLSVAPHCSVVSLPVARSLLPRLVRRAARPSSSRAGVPPECFARAGLTIRPRSPARYWNVVRSRWNLGSRSSQPSRRARRTRGAT